MKIKVRIQRNHGIALREVLAIVSIVVLILFVMTPALANLRMNRNAAICLSNLRQLGWAWQLYTEDNAGKLVQNYHGGGTAAAGDGSNNAPWAAGWLDWGTSADNTNILYLRNARYSRLAPYYASSRNIHKCPSDNFISTPQRFRGWKARTRSVAMNMTVGGGNAMTGPWDPLYRQTITMADMIIPSPAETAVIMEEHPDSINDPGLWAPRSNFFIDLPAS